MLIIPVIFLLDTTYDENILLGTENQDFIF